MEGFKTAGQKKIDEYVKRIEDGESKDSIVQGLPSSFVSGIEEELQEREAKENRNKAKDAIDLNNVRERLGIVGEKNIQADELLKTEDIDVKKRDISFLIKYVTEGKKQAVIDLYKKFIDNIDDDSTRTNLASGLFQGVYSKYRSAEYPNDPQEEEIWEQALKSTNIGIDNRKPEWLYRGNFPKSGETLYGRGSFNVRVTPELISSLDNLILSGKINANYKFGQPGTPASPNERHDSISIYFIDEPSAEALEEISNIIKPYVRGDSLLGKKISDGFYMSEVGSIETPHIDAFVESLKFKDAAFAEAVRRYTAPQVGKGNQLKMSEAQYYAIKDVAKAFGYDISYDKEKGFDLK